MKASSSAGGLAVSNAVASGFGDGSLGSPVVLMIDVKLVQRPGWSIAICWPIMPPIDAPTMCARPIPSASSRPTASAAISLIVYGTLGFRPIAIFAISAIGLGTSSWSNQVDRPMSRLSKRITWKPRSASWAQNTSSQPSICVPSPITSSIAGFAGSPKVW